MAVAALAHHEPCIIARKHDVAQQQAFIAASSFRGETANSTVSFTSGFSKYIVFRYMIYRTTIYRSIDIIVDAT